VPGSGAPAPRSNAPPPFDAKRFEQLQETVKKEPRNYNALVELGEIEADQRRFPEAAAWYLKALAANDTVEARNSLGIALFLSNRPDEAIEQFKKVLEKEPGNPEALYDLGIVLAEGKNDPAGAVALWERLVELNPNLPDIDTVKRNIENLKQKRP
jgi:tetratricopeptide (TPR) repeat protein